MHRQLVILLLTALVFAAPGVAHAKPCTTQGAPSATALPLDEPKSLAGLMTNLGVWLTALADRGFERNLQKMGGACERTAFEAAGRQYVLRGENGGQVADRLALASSRGAPLAYVMAVPDLVAALKVAAGHNL